MIEEGIITIYQRVITSEFVLLELLLVKWDWTDSKLQPNPTPCPNPNPIPTPHPIPTPNTIFKWFQLPPLYPTPPVNPKPNPTPQPIPIPPPGPKAASSIFFRLRLTNSATGNSPSCFFFPLRFSFRLQKELLSGSWKNILLRLELELDFIIWRMKEGRRRVVNQSKPQSEDWREIEQLTSLCQCRMEWEDIGHQIHIAIRSLRFLIFPFRPYWPLGIQAQIFPKLTKWSNQSTTFNRF